MIQSSTQLAHESSRPSEDEATWARWHASRVGCPFNEEVETEPSDKDPEWLKTERAEFDRLVAQLRADPNRQSLIEKARAASETPWVDPFDYTVSVLLRTNEVTEAEEEWLSEYAADLGADWYTDGRDHTYWWPTEADERKAVARMRTQPWYEGMQATAPEEPERWPGLAAPEAPTMPSAAPSANEEPVPGTQAPGKELVHNRIAAEMIWHTRPVFRAIRGIATERMVSPWAVLGGVLAQVACRISPRYQLPPTVGGHASLNLFVGLVGPSGSGKGAATATAEEFLGVRGKIPTRKLGTGQGIDASFTAQHPKEGAIQFNDVALFTVGEIDTLAAHSSMNGSTLLSTMREVYDGAALGAHYAAKEKRRPVRAHRYRAAVIAGIQPARAGVLLDDADGGTPQRWVWLPTNDVETDRPVRFMPPTPEGGWWTDYEVWAPNGENPDDEPVPGWSDDERVEIPVCAAARNAVRGKRKGTLFSSLTAQGEGLGGHQLLTQLKVAALLGFLDRRCGVTDEDWALAGQIMAVSDAARRVCQDEISNKSRKAAQARGRNEAAKEEAKEDATEQRMVARACKAVLTRLGNSADGELVHKQARGIDAKLRPYFEQAVELLRQTGQLQVEQRPARGGGGTATWYRVTKR
ncbi:hypothetical protein [Micromonospora marina]|uniref:hypothetical protein n=1 Tax=Micromonospora marina TaxID=307120 RepID=UPI003D75456F